MYELYEQLLPTKLYEVKKIKPSQSSNMSCRMCNKAPGSLAHVLSGYLACEASPGGEEGDWGERNVRRGEGGLATDPH